MGGHQEWENKTSYIYFGSGYNDHTNSHQPASSYCLCRETFGCPFLLKRDEFLGTAMPSNCNGCNLWETLVLCETIKACIYAQSHTL